MKPRVPVRPQDHGDYKTRGPEPNLEFPDRRKNMWSQQAHQQAPESPSRGNVQVKGGQVTRTRLKLSQLAVVHHAGDEQQEAKPSDLGQNLDALTAQELDPAPSTDQCDRYPEQPPLVDGLLMKTHLDLHHI